MCSPQDSLFLPLLPFTRPPVEAQVRSQDPHLKEKCDIFPPKQTFLENMTIFISRSSNLTVIFVKKEKKNRFLFKISGLKPLLSMKSAHKPPLSWQFIRSQAPKFGNPGSTYIPEKKSWVPPRDFFPQILSTLKGPKIQSGTFFYYHLLHRMLTSLWYTNGSLFETNP